jgi:hypothetical protein
VSSRRDCAAFQYTGNDDELRRFIAEHGPPGVAPPRAPAVGDWLATDGEAFLVYTAAEVKELHKFIR